MKKILILSLLALTLSGCGSPTTRCYKICRDEYYENPTRNLDRNPTWCRSYCSYYGTEEEADAYDLG